MDKKILVILTGGTIGSVVKNNTIGTNDGSTYILINEYVDKFGVNDDFDIKEPYTILSENTTPQIWSKLFNYIMEQNLNEYKGIIITHGTDTYSYTAAFLGMLFDSFLKIPLVLVSSNYAIGEKGSNGLNNFRNAVCFINSEPKEQGVFCVYENNKGENDVYRGRQITEADTSIDQFKAFGGECFGQMINEKFKKNPLWKDSCRPYTDFGRILDLKNINLTKDVLLIKNYPGLNYKYYDIKYNKPAAVVHYLYHSATACVESKEKYSFVEFSKKCKNENITVFAAGFKEKLENEYSTMKYYESIGIQKLYNMSLEAAYTNILIYENNKKK